MKTVYLDIEFIKPSPFRITGYNWLGLMVFISSLIITLFLWKAYEKKHAQLLLLTTNINQLKQQSQPIKPDNIAVKTIIPAEKKVQIQTIVTALLMPWNDILQSIETVNTPDIALLNILPNTKSQQIILSGEGKNIQSVLSYVNQLQAQAMLEKVYLQKYLIDTNNVSKPVKFTIYTQWRKSV